MNINSLRPAKDHAIKYGVKAIIYGSPGTGKTPIAGTAPRPVLLACEPGLLSMRHSNVPTWTGFTAATIDEFFEWFFKSNETKAFDTLAIDSVSQMCEIYIKHFTKPGKHGLQVYGDMATKVMEYLDKIYYFPQKHAYLISKESVVDMNGIKRKIPYFPGRELPVRIPHLYDEVLHLNTHPIPGVGERLSFRCKGTLDVMARDRTDMLSEYEPPDFGVIVKKCMS